MLGPWEFLWRAGSCIYVVCVSPLCGVPGRYKLIWAFPGAGGGTVRIFPFSWLCSGGYGTVEMVKRVVRIFFAFFSFVSSLGGWVSAVGILCYIFSVGGFVVFFCVSSFLLVSDC